MSMNFLDRSTINDATMRRTPDGYVVAEVPVARTGIQDYAGYEMGKPELPKVRVYRPPEEVFADSHLVSIAHKPVTNDHPKESVTAATWKRDAVGYMGESIRKDEANGLIIVPLMFADQAAITQLDSGKREVSMGYTCEIDWTPGVTDSGESYDAVQRNIRANHVALVTRGRAGYACRVGDNWVPIEDNKEPVLANKVITFDGLPVEVTDAAEAVINKLSTALNDEKEAKAQVERDLNDAKAELATEQGKVAALDAQVKDAAITPEKLAKLVADRATLIDTAKAIDPNGNFDTLSDAEIQAAAVKAKLGDRAPTDAAQIAGAFSVLASQVETKDGLRTVVEQGVKTADADTDKAVNDAYADYLNRLHNPLKTDA